VQYTDRVAKVAALEAKCNRWRVASNAANLRTQPAKLEAQIAALTAKEKERES
jgi:hypothetical protein